MRKIARQHGRREFPFRGGSLSLMKTGVVVFPGSNCDRDALSTLAGYFKGEWGGDTSPGSVARLWHGDTSLPELDLIVVPGGFSYGDYLRSGAMAAHSPIMKAIKEHAAKGKMVLGICNGFQILTEAGLLPGTLIRNANLAFLCKPVHLRVEQGKSKFTRGYATKQVVELPIAHHDGCYFADDATLDTLESNDQVLFRYSDSAGNITAEANPNGSARNIAGICNEMGNVAAMMPHPERVCDALTGGTDGQPLFRGLLRAA